MSKYIDANEMRNVLLQRMAGTGYQSRALDCLNYVKTYDVAPVIHAHWKIFHTDFGLVAECTNCKRHIVVDYAFQLKDYLYCHCGAKMDKQEDE